MYTRVGILAAHAYTLLDYAHKYLFSYVYISFVGVNLCATQGGVLDFFGDIVLDVMTIDAYLLYIFIYSHVYMYIHIYAYIYICIHSKYPNVQT